MTSISGVPVTVEVRPNGQVYVNGVLVAEVVIGEVVARDRLAEELALHRTAHVIYERLTTLVRYVCNGKSNGNPGSPTTLDAKERADFGTALFTGLAGEPGELTGRAFYRDGHRAGVTLRALRDRLGELLDEPDRQLDGGGW